MSEYPKQNPTTHINLREVKNWIYSPTETLWRADKNMNIKVTHSLRQFGTGTITQVLADRIRRQVHLIKDNPHNVNIPEEIKQTAKPLTDGPMANVEHITIQKNTISITTSETSWYKYLAGAYRYGYNQGENPSRPLTVLTVLYTQRGDILLEKRGATIDFPNSYGACGGALRPEETNIKQAALERIQRKWGIDVDRKELQLTGMGRENLGNIYCLFFMSTIDQELANKIAGERENFSLVKSSELKEFLEKTPIPQVLEGKLSFPWNFLGREGMLLAAEKIGTLSPQNIEDVKKYTSSNLSQQFQQYRYPVEEILGKHIVEPFP
ncbi:MAG: hypothetical protein E6H08_21490 [Bacteroidetes bacterium]|nr:MAG: hypothetical protein E6H08_21490 [Bacteroidota bacterium]